MLLFTDLSFLLLRQLHLFVKFQIFNSRPDCRRDRPTKLRNKPKLLLFRTALHNRRSGPHLRHNTPSPPQIHRRAVISLPQQQLGRPVPQRHHPIRKPIRLPLLISTKGPGQSEVGQLQHTVLCDQHVGGLHVAVQDLVAVDVIEAVEQLLHHLLDLAEREFDATVRQQAGQVVLAELKD